MSNFAIFCGIAIFYVGIAGLFSIGEENSWFRSKVYNSIFAFILFTALSVGNVSFYYSNGMKIAELQRNLDYDLPNLLTFLNGLDSKVLVKTENTRLIIDVANQGQSVVNTEQWKNLVDFVNGYNREYMEQLYMRQHPVISTINGGFFPRDMGQLKYVKLSELK